MSSGVIPQFLDQLRRIFTIIADHLHLSSVSQTHPAEVSSVFLIGFGAIVANVGLGNVRHINSEKSLLFGLVSAFHRTFGTPF